jgi:alkylhydroperoxidase/carboxymuconolactone decarboxylase family protein YurZ
MSRDTSPGSLAYFQEHIGATGDAIVGFIDTLYRECQLDPKTRELVFIGIQTALRLPRAIKVHIPRAQEAGATDEEILWAITLALPNAGLNCVTESFGVAREMLRDRPPART